MSFVENVHRGFVYSRRVVVLAEEVAALLPQGASVLDVGCGDGLIDTLVTGNRPDVKIEGIDVLVRGKLHIPVKEFDGKTIPHPDGSFDAVTFIDVLHHTDDPSVLIREAARVARKAVIIKDHLLSGLLAETTLRFMDRVGNESYGVRLPYNYWPRARWNKAFDDAGLKVESWNGRSRIYPWWANWVFGRGLHFVAKLGH